MQTLRRAHLPVIALIGLAALVSACATSGSGSLTVPLPVANGPLLTVESRGGECMAGPCGSTVVIERDGKVHSADKLPNDLGILPPEQLAALDTVIKATDFAVLANRPFTGECPTAFDGQEYIFEFGAPNGTQRIATCEVAVDYGSPVFVAVAAALAEFMPLPIP